MADRISWRPAVPASLVVATFCMMHLTTTCVLADIVWTNPNGTPVEHYLDDIGDEQTVVDIVHAAFDYWNDLVDADLNIGVQALNTGQPGGISGVADVTASDENGVPTDATIILNAAENWFLDTTPYDDYEFSNGFESAFVALNNNSGAGRDLFRTVVHEICHCLGFTRNALNTTVLTNGLKIEDLFGNEDENDEFTLDGETVTFNGTHLDGTAHQNNLMNNGVGIGNRRQLIPELVLRILEEAYEYAIFAAATDNRRTFYVVHDSSGSTGEIFIQGDVGTFDDDITVFEYGISVAIDVNGVERKILETTVSSITAIGGAGNDTIVIMDYSIDALIGGGDGDDLLVGAWGNDTIVGGGGSDTIYGGYGNDELYGVTGTNDVGFGGNGTDTHIGDFDSWTVDGDNWPW